MRDLTIQELDSELAEQLPTRELMGGYCYGGHPSYSSYSSTHQTNVANVGNSSSSQRGFVNVNASNDNVQALTLGSTNGGNYVSQGNFAH